MSAAGRFRAIGLMSGTSMDGIDAAVLETDGEAHLTIGPHASTGYPPDLRRTLLRLRLHGSDVTSIEREVTDLHCQAVRALCASRNIDLATIDVIGFHGQTIRHQPQEGRTWQLGDGQRMAESLARPVVNNFRQNDMNHGGQGAPLSAQDGAATLSAFTAAAIAAEAQRCAPKEWVVNERPYDWPADGWLNSPQAMARLLESLSP